MDRPVSRNTQKEAFPKVSIIIPVYNGANFLHQSIVSALEQTYSNIEVLVIDDGSSDGGATRRIAESYGDKISYYYKNNGGVASALNFGIEKMRGDYISWLSHDDLYERTKVARQVEGLRKISTANRIIACDSVALFDNGLRKRYKIPVNIFNDHFEMFLACSATVGVNGCSLLIPRSAVRTVGGFNINLPVTQDYDLWWRLSKYNRFILLQKPLVIYRHHAGQDSARRAELCRVEADKLRSSILANISKKETDRIMAHEAKWMWNNYATYARRGYTRTAFGMLRIILNYYNEHNPRILKKIILKSSIVSFVGKYKDVSTLLEDINKEYPDRLESDYIRKMANYAQKHSRIHGYAESLKSDGLGFMIKKACNKIYRKLRRGR